VNILGSLFYGTLLGIFIIAFGFNKIGGNATFIAALIAELTVLACFFFTEIPYLWFNVIGCVVLIILAYIMNLMFRAMNSNKA
jgi:SSS family solute:Na+ symporter